MNDEPAVEMIGTDYYVRWQFLSLRFAKLKEHSEGYSAFLVISGNNMPGHGSGMIFEGRLQLQGTRSKAEVVKECEKRIPDVDWTSKLTHSCRLVMEAIEEGDPLIDLSSLIPVQPRRYILEPLLRESEPTLLFGAGGIGKSTIALAIAVILSTGQARASLNPEGQHRIVYLDYEDSEDNVADRLAHLANGFELTHSPQIYYKRGAASLPNMVDALSRQIAREKITGLITDSAALACGAEPESADAANTYFRALRALNLAWSLTIAHQPHNMIGDPRPFGSVFWQNNPRAIWHARKSQEEGEDILHLGLWHTKANNTRLSPPLGFKINHVEGITAVETEQIANVSDFHQHLKQPQRVLVAIKDAGSGITYDELHQVTQIAKSSLYKVVERLGNKVQLHNGRLFRGAVEA